MSSSDGIESLLIDKLREEILTKLDGSHSSMRRFPFEEKPSRQIITGTIAHLDKDPQSLKKSTVIDNSVSVMFLSESVTGDFLADVHLAVYYRVAPTYSEQTTRGRPPDTSTKRVQVLRVWKKADVDFTGIKLEISRGAGPRQERIDLSQLVQKVKSDRELVPILATLEADAVRSENDFKSALSNAKTRRTMPKFDWKAHIEIIAEDFKQGNKVLTLFKILLMNDTEPDDYETFLFDVGLKVKIANTELTPFEYAFEYDDFPLRYTSLLRSKNLHFEYDDSKRMISSRHHAVFDQPRIQPKTSLDSSSEAALLFSEPDHIAVLEKMVKGMEAKLAEYQEEKAMDDRFEFYLARYHRNTMNVRDGLELLKKGDPNLNKAFSMMQQTFAIASNHKGWRLFQIAFILAIMPCIADNCKGRETIELLHVHTGGGKSEAYFGAIVLAMFWDRLTGKKLGITALTKFPLRMLSVQQLQRIARVVACADEIRKNSGIDGDNFSVGYFVGNSRDFPRYCNNIIEKIDKHGPVPGKIIQDCPICGAVDSVVVDHNKTSESTVHRCEECDRLFFLYYSDDEIYRFLPSFVVCTVDKLAGVSSNRRFRNLLGGHLSSCSNGHGYVPSNDRCEVRIGKDVCQAPANPVPKTATAPTLVVQDELHLVREGFGGINAQFETLLFEIQKRLAGYEPKRIAMTATITGAKEQVRQLYGKDLSIFPGESPYGLGVNDFFFEIVRDNNGPVVQRRIVGLRPNNRDNQYASLLTIRYLAETIDEFERNPGAIAAALNTTPERITALISFFKNVLTYHKTKMDVHSMSYLLEQFVNSNLRGSEVIGTTLTGDDSLETIRKAILDLESFGTKPEHAHKIQATFATSVVSHGIDIDRLNLMIFQGIPNNTSEYIQALSRVGRQHTGMVIVWFYPNRVRDLSFYENFIGYHGLLYQMVEKVPISRWAKLVFTETFASVFCASVLNYFSDVENKPLYTVESVNKIFSSTNPTKRQELVELIRSGMLADANEMGAAFFDQRIPVETEAFLNYLRDYRGPKEKMSFFPNALQDSQIRHYRTQFGMRGIQEVVPIQVELSELGFLKLYKSG